MLLRSQIDKMTRPLTPAHSMAEGTAVAANPESSGTHRHGPHCGSAYHPGDPSEVTVTSGKPKRKRKPKAATDPATGKSYDFLGTMQAVTSPEDIGPAGLFTGKALPPDAAPHAVPQLVSPERFRKGPITAGQARPAVPGAYDPPNTAPSRPVTPRSGRFSGTGRALTSRMPGEGSLCPRQAGPGCPRLPSWAASSTGGTVSTRR